MNFQWCWFFIFTVAQHIPRCAKMDMIEKISRQDYKTSKGCSFLLEEDNIDGPTDSSLFLLCNTFHFIPESNFCILPSLLAFLSK